MSNGNYPMRNFIGILLANKSILDLGCGDCSFIEMFDDADKKNILGLN